MTDPAMRERIKPRITAELFDHSYSLAHFAGAGVTVALALEGHFFASLVAFAGSAIGIAIVAIQRGDHIKDTKP